MLLGNHQGYSKISSEPICIVRFSVIYLLCASLHTLFSSSSFSFSFLGVCSNRCLRTFTLIFFLPRWQWRGGGGCRGRTLIPSISRLFVTTTMLLICLNSFPDVILFVVNHAGKRATFCTTLKRKGKKKARTKKILYLFRKVPLVTRGELVLVVS